MPLESSQVCADKPTDEGEGSATTSAVVAFRGTSSTPAKHMILIRKRKKKTGEDMSEKIFQSSTAADHEHRCWRGHMRKGQQWREWLQQERQRDQEVHWEVHQDIMGLLRQRTQMLEHYQAIC
ncbi:unnamed protein product [Caretta caretta]